MGKVYAVWTFHPQNNPPYVHASPVEQGLLIRFLPFYKRDLIFYNDTTHFGIRQVSSYLVYGGSFCT